jgi:hypothetical protein
VLRPRRCPRKRVGFCNTLHARASCAVCGYPLLSLPLSLPLSSPSPLPPLSSPSPSPPPLLSLPLSLPPPLSPPSPLPPLSSPSPLLSLPSPLPLLSLLRQPRAVAQVFNRHNQQGSEEILPALSFHEGFCCSCRRIRKDCPWRALRPAPQPPLQRGQRRPLPFPGLQPTLAANTVIRCTGHDRRIVPSWG